MTPSSRDDDLRQRRLAEAGRADEEHVVERLLPRPRRLDEDLEVGAGLRLADELGEELRAERRVRRVVAGATSGATHAAHRASSLRPRRMSVSAVAASPAERDAAATAALAWTWA